MLMHVGTAHALPLLALAFRAANEKTCNMGPVGFAEKQAETLFRLICCERKTLFWPKNKLKSMDYKRSEQGHEALAATFETYACNR